MKLTSTTLSFGVLLKHLRKQAGMTQRDLAAALNYSDSLISSLEKEQRKPDLAFVVERLLPALGLQDDPKTAAWLVERAAVARGEQPPASFTLQRTTQLLLREELPEQTTLPTPPTHLIGRDEEVTQLCHRLLGHQGRLLTLVGPPGIGKTTLALAVADQLQPHYRDGVIFVPLAAVNEATSMASAILAAAGSRASSAKPPKARLIEFLRRKTILLVLDNLEQVSDAAPLIADLLVECSGLIVLATSRERLHLRAEQRYKVPALVLAAAVELFVQRAQAVDKEFRLTAHNYPSVEAICERLDRLPLALELCAAQIELFSPAQLLTQLHARPLDLLVDGAYDLPPQQRTLRRAIARSYALLEEEEGSLFRSLGVFLGGFDLAAVAAVLQQRLETEAIPQALVARLRSLVGKSLVHTETLPTGEQRFWLLETLREFALEQIHAQGEEAELRQRHYLAYLHLFRTGDSPLRGPEDEAWLARLLPEQDNLRSALHWALATTHYPDAAWLMLAVSYFWNRCGYGYEEAKWLGQLLPYRQRLAPDLRLAILLTFYRAGFALAEFQPIQRYMEEIMHLLAEGAHQLLQANAWCFRAWTIADVAQAMATTERGIGLAREAPALGIEYGALADRDFALAAHLWGYAAFLIGQGELMRATPIAAESLQLFRKRGNQPGIGESLGTLGRLALLQGDLAQAHQRFQEAVTIAGTLSYSALQSEWQALLAITTLYRGDAGEARRLLAESLRRSLDQKNTILLAQVCTYLAETALYAGELDKAEQWLVQSLDYHGAARRATIYEAEWFFVAARLATAQQEYPRAALLFGLAEQAHSQIHYVIAGPMRALADTALETVRAALDPRVFAEAFAAGQQMAFEKTFPTVLVPAAGVGTMTEA